MINKLSAELMMPSGKSIAFANKIDLKMISSASREIS